MSEQEMKNKKEHGNGRDTLFQFIKFGLVGVSNTLISWGVYAVCIRLGAHYMLANLIGFLISVLNSFYWNNKYVFKEEESERVWWKALLRTYVAYGTTGLVLNTILLYVWLDLLHIGTWLEPACQWFYDRGIVFENAMQMAEYAAPIFNYCITIPLNFLLNKFWAYSSKEKETSCIAGKRGGSFGKKSGDG